MGLVNIAKNSKVKFSSMSQWSTDEDCREIVTAEHNRDYSFHTNFEKKSVGGIRFGRHLCVTKYCGVQ